MLVSDEVKPLQGPARTSGLLAPIMLLTGHAGEVFTCKFNPTGDVIASGSHDKHVFLWRTYGECENFLMMKGIFAATATQQLSDQIRACRIR